MASAPIVRPLVGPQTKIAFGYCSADPERPYQATRRASFATSTLSAEDKKVFGDSIDGRSSEFDEAVPGTFEPSGDVELLIKEDGAVIDLLNGAYGHPTTVAAEDDLGAPIVGWYDHEYVNKFDDRYLTIAEQIGPDLMWVDFGARVNRFSVGCRKTQDRVLFVQANLMALNKIRHNSLAQTGLATAVQTTADPFPAVAGKMYRGGAFWSPAMELQFVMDNGLQRVENQDGFRGMGTFSPGHRTQVEVTAYLQNDREYKAFTGVDFGTAAPYGPKLDVKDEDLRLVIPGKAHDGAQPLFIIDLYRATLIPPFDKGVRRGEGIMLRLNFQVRHKASEGNDHKITLRNRLTNAQMIAAGTVMAGIPQNDGSAYYTGNPDFNGLAAGARRDDSFVPAPP